MPLYRDPMPEQVSPQELLNAHPDVTVFRDRLGAIEVRERMLGQIILAIRMQPVILSHFPRPGLRIVGSQEEYETDPNNLTAVIIPGLPHGAETDDVAVEAGESGPYHGEVVDLAIRGIELFDRYLRLSLDGRREFGLLGGASRKIYDEYNAPDQTARDLEGTGINATEDSIAGINAFPVARFILLAR